MSIRNDITAGDGWFIGEDKQIRFPLTDPAGTPLNITGYTIQFKVSATLSGDPIAALTKTAALTAPSSGICTVTIPAADTLTLTPTTYFYVLRRTDVGFKSELAYGSIVLNDVFVNY
jgi:hypothetical protein